MRLLLGWCLLLLSGGVAALGLDYVAYIRPVLSEHCFKCHGEKKQKGGLRLDNLEASFLETQQLEAWDRVREALTAHDMPPEDEKQPGDTQRAQITGWIDAQLRAAAAIAQNAVPPARMRRLTVQEYNRTLQDLFGVKVNFAKALPPDPISAQGFQNDVGLLTISTLQMEYCLEIARTAVANYVAFEPVPVMPLHYHIEMEDVYYTTKDRDGTMKQAPGPLALDRAKARAAAPQYSLPLMALPPGELPSTENLRPSQPKLHQQYVPLKNIPHVGDVIVRVRAAGTPGRDGSLPRLRIEAGVAYGDGDGLDAWRLGEVDVNTPMDRPVVYEFRARLEDIPKPKRAEDIESLFDMVQLFIANVSRDERAIYDLGPGSLEHSQTPGIAKDAKKLAAAEKKLTQTRGQIDKMIAAGVNQLHLDSIEIEIIPGAGSAGEFKWQVQAKLPPRAAAEELLRRFMPAAYRRPVVEQEVAEKLALFDTLFAKGDIRFEDSLRETLMSVLVSPNFLLLESDETAGPHRLANRLSYFLWSAPPDAKLREIASRGDLQRSEVYTREATRLLDDPRSQVLLDDFCRQWLRLDKFPLIAVNPEFFPGYDDDFADISLEEPLALFREVFVSGASALDLLYPGYAMLNDRLARHYGLPAVKGGDLKRVNLPPDSVRGGLVGQAAILTMNADGVDSHPIRRGVWMVDRLLGNPPPPPPPNVPDLNEDDPDFRGLTLKQRIEKHREPGNCRDCHQRFDPWGIALENFDAIGKWREAISVRHDKKSAASPVDAVARMPGGITVHGAADLIRHLREQDGARFTQALTQYLMTYALGHKLTLADRLTVEQVHARFARSEFKLKELILAVAESDAFKR